MEIPKLNISVTKAAINGRVFDVVKYEDYIKNPKQYIDRADVAIPTEHNGREILLPVRGKYSKDSMSPGIYNDGIVDFFKYPDEPFMDRFIPKNYISMSNLDSIKELIVSTDNIKKLDEPFITAPDNITQVQIGPNDQPEMVGLKMAINSKHIDLDSYASRFGDNYPNDKRQLKQSSATIKIIKRFCNNCDMDAILTFRDKNPDVPNPMCRDISISLTGDDSDILNFMNEPEDPDNEYDQD